MGMFSICKDCAICGVNFCVAGNGDDEYQPASKKQVIERLDKGQYKYYREQMKRYLKEKFNYDYDKAKGETTV